MKNKCVNTSKNKSYFMIFLKIFFKCRSYSKEFGLYHVARNTDALTRTPKATALIYKEIIEKAKQHNVSNE